MSKILATLLLLVACNQPSDEATDAFAASSCPSTVLVTYIVHDIVTLDEHCQGFLPFIATATLYDNGTVFVEGSSDTGSIALWKKDAMGNLIISYIWVAGWKGTLVLAPTPEQGYAGQIKWFNPITNGQCEKWLTDWHL